MYLINMAKYAQPYIKVIGKRNIGLNMVICGAVAQLAGNLRIGAIHENQNTQNLKQNETNRNFTNDFSPKGIDFNFKWNCSR